MKFKALTFGLIALLTLSTVSAIQASPQEDPYSIDAGSFQEIAMNVDQANGTVSVQSTSKSTQNLTISPNFYNNEFQQGDNIPFQLSASESLDPGNYTVNVSLQDEYEVEETDGNNTTTTTQIDTSTSTFNLEYDIPYKSVFQQSVDQGQTIAFVDSGFEMTVASLSSDEVSFTSTEGNNCLSVSDSCKFEKDGTQYRISVENIYPSRGFATLNIESLSDPTVRISQDKGGKITVRKSFPSEPVVRGETFEFQTVDNATGDRIGNVKVRFRGDDYGTFSSPETGEFGYSTFQVPEDFNKQKIRYQVLAVSSDKDYELGSGIFTIPKSYQDYVDNNNLTFYNLPDQAKIGEAVEAQLKSVSGKALQDAEAQIELPSGTITRGVNKNGVFTFEVPEDTESGANITLKGVRTNSESSDFNTKQKQISVIGNKDDDPLLDHKDECPEEFGPEENNGCPVTETEAHLFTYEGTGEDRELKEEVDELKPKTSYLVKFVEENASDPAEADPVEVSGTLNVTNSSDGVTTYEVEQGVARIGFKDEGSYSLSFDESSISSIEQDYDVEGGGSLPVGQFLMAVLIVLILLAVVYVAYKTNIIEKLSGGGGSKSSSDDVGVGAGSMAGRPAQSRGGDQHQ